MANKTKQIADAIVTSLNAIASPSLEFVAERVYHPELQRPDFEELHVCVGAGRHEAEIHSRGNRWTEDHIVTIAVIREVKLEDLTEQDELADFLQEIEDHLASRSTTMADARLIARESDAVFDQDDLEMKAIFRGLLNLTYRVVREPS